MAIKLFSVDVDPSNGCDQSFWAIAMWHKDENQMSDNQNRRNDEEKEEEKLKRKTKETCDGCCSNAKNEIGRIMKAIVDDTTIIIRASRRRIHAEWFKSTIRTVSWRRSVALQQNKNSMTNSLKQKWLIWCLNAQISTEKRRWKWEKERKM